MRFFFLIFVTLFVISFNSEKAVAINVQCSFATKERGYGFGNKHGCDVESVTLSSSEDREITSVNGDQGKTYNDVLWFWSHSKTFNFFPKNIKKFFPNVEVVHICSANIATLTKTDLSPFGSKLKILDLNSNIIEVLDGDLFDANPNLEQVHINNNQIKFVAKGIFNNLPNLKTFYFSSSPCYSTDNFYNNRAAVLNVIKQVESNCQDQQAYEKFKNLFPTTTTTTTTEKVKTEQEIKIEQLTTEITNLKQHKEELQQKVDKGKVESSHKDAKIEKIEKENEDLKLKIAVHKPCDDAKPALQQQEKLHEILMKKLAEMEGKIEAKLDTNKDMIIKATEAKLDTTDENFVSINATCFGLDYKFEELKADGCLRQP